MITLYLVRHGQTTENIARIFQGHLPGTLTEEGKKQARELGDKLCNLDIDAVVSSDLKRVTDTVEIALAGRTLPWEQTPLLRERDWGTWTGLPICSVDLTRLPADAETTQMLYDRAGEFLAYLKRNYDGKHVLVVSHGQINRAIQAHLLHLGPTKMGAIAHMDNAEVRKFMC